MLVTEKLPKTGQLKKLINKIKKKSTNCLRPSSSDTNIVKCIKSNRKQNNIEYECPFMKALMKNQPRNCFVTTRRPKIPPTTIESEVADIDPPFYKSVIGVSPGQYILKVDRTDVFVSCAFFRFSKKFADFFLKRILFFLFITLNY